MVKTHLYSILSGKTFSPKKAEKLFNISLNDKNEPGDIGKTGRYKGRKIPFGSCVFEEGSDNNLDEQEKILVQLESCLSELHNINVEDIILHLDVEYEGQCNFELSGKFLTKASLLKIPLTISCYSVE